MLPTVVGDLLDALLPMRCPICRRRATPLCALCVSQLRDCAPVLPPPGITWWTALYAYEGTARELIARAKYRNERAALAWFGARLADACAHAPLRPDVVTWAPASATRRAAFGVDHAEVLARVVSRRLALPAVHLLGRLPGPPQTGRAAVERRAGPRFRAHRSPGPATILVIDDVTTTGGTLATAARVLREAGAHDILAATAARTPPPQ
jgi:predicted amidophosphoribosyltransferase